MDLGKEKNIQDHFLSYRLHICATPIVFLLLAWSIFASLVNFLLCKMSVLEQHTRYHDLWGKMDVD